MSITVDNVSYLTGMRQNTRTSTAEKQEQNEAAADVGKTQRSAVSASLDEVNMGREGIAITEVSRQQGAEQSATQTATPHTDTVEISEKGRAASAQMQSQQTGTEAAEVVQYEGEALSEYTDTELKLMYYRDEITRQEYEDETGGTLS